MWPAFHRRLARAGNRLRYDVHHPWELALGSIALWVGFTAAYGGGVDTGAAAGLVL